MKSTLTLLAGTKTNNYLSGSFESIYTHLRTSPQNVRQSTANKTHQEPTRDMAPRVHARSFPPLVAWLMSPRQQWSTVVWANIHPIQLEQQHIVFVIIHLLRAEGATTHRTAQYTTKHNILNKQTEEKNTESRKWHWCIWYSILAHYLEFRIRISCRYNTAPKRSAPLPRLIKLTAF